MVRRFVFAASSSAYGESPTLPKQEDMIPLPISPYAVTKLTCEHYCQVFHRSYGLETLSLRYFNVFGPRQDPASQYAAVIPAFVAALLKDQQPAVFGDGEQTRDFTHVQNVISANMLAAEIPTTQGQVVNIACQQRISLNEILAILRELLGKDIPAKYAGVRPGDVRDSLADITRAKELLGYEPRIDFEQGLRLAIDWYKENL
jgi:nucleoside-diphosphate-sugar epimerase